MSRCLKTVGSVFATTLGCVSPVDVDISVVNPCNQQAIQEVDFLRFEPRGKNVDSNGLTVVQRTADNITPAIPIPLTTDFQLVVTGHRESFDNPAQAIGVSPRFDLSGAVSPVSIGVPFGLVDKFYRTTDLDDPVTCSDMAVAPLYRQAIGLSEDATPPEAPFSPHATVGSQYGKM